MGTLVFRTLIEDLPGSASAPVAADMKRALSHDTDAALVASDARMRRWAMETLGNLDKTALALHAGTIVGVLADADDDVRLEAAFTLSNLNANALALHAEAIVSVLRDPNARVRQEAVVVALGKLNETLPTCPRARAPSRPRASATHRAHPTARHTDASAPSAQR